MFGNDESKCQVSFYGLGEFKTQVWLNVNM